MYLVIKPTHVRDENILIKPVLHFFVALLRRPAPPHLSLITSAMDVVLLAVVVYPFVCKIHEKVLVEF